MRPTPLSVSRNNHRIPLNHALFSEQMWTQLPSKGTTENEKLETRPEKPRGGGLVMHVYIYSEWFSSLAGKLKYRNSYRSIEYL